MAELGADSCKASFGPKIVIFWGSRHCRNKWKKYIHWEAECHMSFKNGLNVGKMYYTVPFSHAAYFTFANHIILYMILVLDSYTLHF